MDLTTIDMERPKAREAFLAYRKAVRERHDDEDLQIMRGYRELARGRQLINIRDVMSAAGVDEKGLPRLAVCRADEKWCGLDMSSDGSVTFIGFKELGWNGDQDHRSTRRRVALGADTLPRFEGYKATRSNAAMVPVVPPALRPRPHLRNYHVLFEAEWQKVPPKDPALLKRIGGDLFAVLAIWDLTELERSVLGGRVVTS